MFEKLLAINCHTKNRVIRKAAANLLEKLYGCEINCPQIDRSVLFAHHARGCTIIAAQICENAVIFQNVTIGANLKYNKTSGVWENVGNPLIAKNVVIADGAKVLGPVIIGENTVVAAGAIITKDVPANSLAFGVNQFKPRDLNYDLLFNTRMIAPAQIIAANEKLIAGAGRSSR